MWPQHLACISVRVEVIEVCTYVFTLERDGKQVSQQPRKKRKLVGNSVYVRTGLFPGLLPISMIIQPQF